MAFTIRETLTDEDINTAKSLFAEYAQSLPFKLNFQNFDAELANLPGDYAPPEGCLMLAFSEQRAAGCIALRALEYKVCEMKRLYVRPAFRGLALGKSLVDALIEKAKRLGYAGMLLDTAPGMTAAQGLYSAYGFKDVSAYCHNPIAGARYMRLTLPGL